MTHGLLLMRRRAAGHLLRLRHGWSFLLTLTWLASTYWLLGPVSQQANRLSGAQPMRLIAAEVFCDIGSSQGDYQPWANRICLKRQNNKESSN